MPVGISEFQDILKKIQTDCICETTGLVDFDLLNQILPMDLEPEVLEELMEYLMDANLLVSPILEPVGREEEQTNEVDFSNALAGYVMEIKSLPPLSREDEQEILKDWNIAGHKQRQLVVQAYLPMVLNLARQKGSRREEILEMIQEGNIALLNAATSYNPSGSRSFRDYARWLILKALIRSKKEQESQSQLPEQIMDFFRRFKSIGDGMKRRMNRQPGIEEIAAEMQMSVDSVMRALSLASNLSEMEQSVAQEDAAFVSFVREVTNNRESNPKRHTAMKMLIKEKLDCLSPVEKEIVTLYYDLDEEGIEYDFFEIGEMLGLKTRLVSDFETAAIMKIMGTGS